MFSDVFWHSEFESEVRLPKNSVVLEISKLLSLFVRDCRLKPTTYVAGIYLHLRHWIVNHVNYALGRIPILCGKSFAYSALPLFHPDAFLLPLAFSIFNARSTSPAPQLVIWTIGRHPNRHVTTSAPRTARKHEGQAVHMHCRVRALRIEMTRRRTRLGLFRTRGKTREAGDPLGELCIPFRTLSLLIMYVITSTNQYSLVSPIHHITPPFPPPSSTP